MGRHGLAVLGAMAACCALAAGPASAARPVAWTASGTLAGSYSNSVGWDNCSDTGSTARATTQENLSLDVKITPGARQNSSLSHQFLVPVTMTLAGGSWSLTGSIPPRQELPQGGIACGAPQDVQCSGSVVQEGGTIRGVGRASIVFSPSGRSIIGRFIQNPGWAETHGDECPIPTSTYGPLYGLRGTDIVADALLENDAHPSYLTIPRNNFARFKPFTATNVAGPDGGCPRIYYDPCSESGSLTLTLHFKPYRSL